MYIVELLFTLRGPNTCFLEHYPRIGIQRLHLHPSAPPPGPAAGIVGIEGHREWRSHEGFVTQRTNVVLVMLALPPEGQTAEC